MIPGEIFTGFAEFQGIVSVNAPLVESDGYVLGELREAYPRVQRYRSRRPQKRLCRRRAAASPGAPCRARLRSP